MLSGRFSSSRRTLKLFEWMSLDGRGVACLPIRPFSDGKLHDLGQEGQESTEFDMSLFSESAIDEMRRASAAPPASSNRGGLAGRRPRPDDSPSRSHRPRSWDRSQYFDAPPRPYPGLPSRSHAAGPATGYGEGGQGAAAPDPSIVDYYNKFSEARPEGDADGGARGFFRRPSYRGYNHHHSSNVHDGYDPHPPRASGSHRDPSPRQDGSAFYRPQDARGAMPWGGGGGRGSSHHHDHHNHQHSDNSSGTARGFDRGSSRDGDRGDSFRHPSRGAAPPWPAPHLNGGVRAKGEWRRGPIDDHAQDRSQESSSRGSSAAEHGHGRGRPTYLGSGPGTGSRKAPTANAPVAKPIERVAVTLSASLTLRELAALLRVGVGQAEGLLRALDERPRSPEDLVSVENCALLLMETEHCDVTVAPARLSPDLLKPRNPVVAVMGHVDHGKTSLLDALRRTAVAKHEAGGITQHIGAFEVILPDSQRAITFLDTPGHKAFSALRSRGAKVTDVCILVVAADDGVMPQTREALQFARAAGCPIIVALTKIDKREANPKKVKQQLLAEGLELEEFGGDVMLVETAAPSGLGVKELEEAVILQADLMELRAADSDHVKAWVVESRLDRGLGPVATVIVKSGSVRVGDFVVVGPHMGRVKALRSVRGDNVKVLLPGNAAELAGLRGLPTAGDELLVCSSEERAKRLAAARSRKEAQLRIAALQERLPAGDAQGTTQGTSSATNGFVAPVAAGAPRTLNLVVKADVQGSLEALEASLAALSAKEVPIKVLESSLGPVSDADVALAAAGPGHVIAFNVANYAKGAADRGVPVQVVSNKVIYRLLEEVERLQDALAPTAEVLEPSGEAQVIRMFDVKGEKKSDPPTRVAGCKVTEGTILSTGIVQSYRVVRSGEVVWEGPLRSLRHLQQEREEIKAGTECGVLLNGFDAFLPGDQLVCVVRRRKAVELTRTETEGQETQLTA